MKRGPLFVQIQLVGPPTDVFRDSYATGYWHRSLKITHQVCQFVIDLQKIKLLMVLG